MQSVAEIPKVHGDAREGRTNSTKDIGNKYDIQSAAEKGKIPQRKVSHLRETRTNVYDA